VTGEQRRGLLVAAALAAAFAFAAAGAAPRYAAAAGPPQMDAGFGFLSYCQLKKTRGATWSCYVTGLLADIERSRDPANELPRLDGLAHRARGFLEGNCHMLMHEVGRRYALRHRVTLATLQRNLPRSNDPGCSAGFGMGLVMALGPQIGKLGPKGAVRTCLSAPTRFRQYTCVHSLGHAYMRLYHGLLAYGLRACRALGSAYAVDCAQGAFHDYWIALGGRDGTTKRYVEVRSPRVLCGRQQGEFVRACWYRYYLEHPPKRLPATAGQLSALCRGLAGIQRAGCIAGASLVAKPTSPLEQTRICANLERSDVASCLRGVRVQNLGPGDIGSQLRLMRVCRTLPRDEQHQCYSWFGLTLSVVTDGRFASQGCARLSTAAARAACARGASQMGRPLVTFS